MDYNTIENRVHSLTKENRFEEAVNLLKKITDLESKIKICYGALVGFAICKVIDEYGEVALLEDKEEYERAKKGMEDLPPHAILYKDENDDVHGLDDMLDFVPEDNPLKRYYLEINED